MTDHPQWKPGNWDDAPGDPLEDMKIFREQTIRAYENWRPQPIRVLVPRWVFKLAGRDTPGGCPGAIMLERDAVEVFMAADEEIRRRMEKDD